MKERQKHSQAEIVELLLEIRNDIEYYQNSAMPISNEERINNIIGYCDSIISLLENEV